MNLIVNEVDKLYHILHAYGYAIGERLARSSVEYLELAVYVSVGIVQIILGKELLNIVLRRAVEYGVAIFHPSCLHT